MGRSFRVGRLLGIRIQIHWSFLLVLGLFAVGGFFSGGATRALGSVLFFSAAFGCVLLHEFGHALAARLFGIETHDITLLPIGGVARLKEMPREPAQELVVALAGPFVNVVIAVGIFAVLYLKGAVVALFAIQSGIDGFLNQLLLINVSLVLFNLIPAFPMDGGRVLRAVLATVMSYEQATRISVRIGQVCAIGLGLLGFINPFLFFIAVFVFLGAASELKQVTVLEELSRFQVRDGMLPLPPLLDADDTLAEAAEIMMTHPKREYPVIRGEKLVGMLQRNELSAALGRGESWRTVSDFTSGDVKTIDESENLGAVSLRAAIDEVTTLAVMRRGRLTGVLDLREVLRVIRLRMSLNTPMTEATVRNS